MTTGFESTLALRATGLLADFNRAGILSAADVHIAWRLGRIGGETDEAVLLAAALVVRSTRHGSVVLDLATAQATTSPEVDEDALDSVAEIALEWPDEWVERCAACALIGGPQLQCAIGQLAGGAFARPPLLRPEPGASDHQEDGNDGAGDLLPTGRK